MFMRFCGGGIGHKGTWHLNASLLHDGQAVQVPEEPANTVVDEQGGAASGNAQISFCGLSGFFCLLLSFPIFSSLYGIKIPGCLE